VDRKPNEKRYYTMLGESVPESLYLKILIRIDDEEEGKASSFWDGYGTWREADYLVARVKETGPFSIPYLEISEENARSFFPAAFSTSDTPPCKEPLDTPDPADSNIPRP